MADGELRQIGSHLNPAEAPGFGLLLLAQYTARFLVLHSRCFGDIQYESAPFFT